MAFTTKDRAFLKALCSQSFYHFAKIVGGYSKQGGDISPFIHGKLCQFAQDQSIIRKQIVMPRNWRKSTVYTILRAIWEYLNDHEVRILVASENAFIAGRLMSLMQRIILEDRLLRWLWPELEAVNTTWTKRNVWNRTECILPRIGSYKEATFTNIGVGGAAQSGHYTHVLLDDVVGRAAMDSPVVLDKVFMWFDNVEELLLEPSRSQINIVGTFWAEGDFCTYAIEKYGYKTMLVPALKCEEALDNWDKTVLESGVITLLNHPNQADWDVNFPEAVDENGDQLFTKAKYEEMRDNPDKAMTFWTQHMNMPNVPHGLNKFDMKWLKYCTIKEIEESDATAFRSPVR